MALVAWVGRTAAQTDADSPLDETLMDGIRKDLDHNRAWIGESYYAGAISDHDHDGVNSSIIGAAITQSELSTAEATGSVARDVAAGNGTTASVISDTSRHAFGPEYAVGSTGDAAGSGGLSVVSGLAPSVGQAFRMTVQATITGGSSGIITTTWRYLYITATSKDFWMYVLYNAKHGFIQQTWLSADHPSYNTGLSDIDMPHPFTEVPEDCVVMLLDNSMLPELRGKQDYNYSLPQIIQNEYVIDFQSSPKYETPREIVEIDWYNKLDGELVRELKGGLNKKRRMVTGLPAIVEYKGLKLK